MLNTLQELLARRYFLRDCALGIGGMALNTLLHSGHGSAGEIAGESPANKAPHFAPRAKRVIFLFMAGGPSHIDLFDPKPLLRKYEGQQVPDAVLRGADLPFIERDAALMSSPFQFRRHGESGAELSELLPHLANVVDDVAIVRSVRTDAINHAPAQIFLNTGHLQLGRPSMGAWIAYGLGSEADDLPAFVILNGTSHGGPACWGSGFLPSAYQGVPFQSSGEPIPFVSNPAGHSTQMQRRTVTVINELNREHHRHVFDPEIATRIEAYEMAFRMQASAPDLLDMSRETDDTFRMYGATPGQASFGYSCLLARRLVERGVRFVTCTYGDWDHHTAIVPSLKKTCAATDQAVAALVRDLKQRGLLDETLVVWGGEFGRTPMVENNAALGRSLGRDHHPNAFTMWMAGGGTRPGCTLGVTDDLGYHVVENPVHIHDMHATMLHLLGLDHERLTYRYQGRNFRLTDVDGRVVKELLE